MDAVGPIDVEEIKLLKADFSRELAAGATIASATWSCEAVSGTDPDASLRRIGQPINQGVLSQQVVGGMLPGVTYSIRCRMVDSTGLAHVAATLLTAERFQAS